MAKLDHTFNTNEMPDKVTSVLKPGPYVARLAKTEEMTSSKGNKYIKFTFRVITEDGTDGAFVSDNIFIKASDADFIARNMAKMRSLMEACGVPSMNDTDELVNKKVVIKVSVDKNNPDYNKIDSYSKKESSLSGFSAPQDTPNAEPSGKISKFWSN